ncbi:MAG: ThuA domain-containing protein [Melioribacteraceae bacterium]|nr:ThuA domain-containing protein [Melioribacteraceae bacterium]
MSASANITKIKVLIIDGQNNHNWTETTPAIKGILEKTGRFTIEISTCPVGLPKKPRIKKEERHNPENYAAWQEKLKVWEKETAAAKEENELAWEKWHPDFHKYDVVVSNYNGQPWPKEIEKDFENYMKQGGGFVAIHAANNAFSEWEEYNKMIGVGGWGGRNENSGPMLRYRNNKWVHDTSPGRGGVHGRQVATHIINQKSDHPIMQGLPERWMHVPDEIYGQLRGPAENITVLAASFSDKKDRGTGELEPGLMVVDYHLGRVFHTTYGHDVYQMQGLGFQITLQRGTEWAATNRVTIPLPKQTLSETVAVKANDDLR